MGPDGVCGACAATAEEPAAFDTVWNYGQYDGVLRRLIHIYKYERVESLAGPLSQLMLDAFPRNGECFDAIVPMPMHWRKQWSRGFNQSALLARSIARRTGIPYADSLRRVKPSKAQAGLSFAGRLQNVRGAFDLRGAKKAWNGAHLLLIDDVFTTGATTSAAARVLKRKGGADRVSILTLARADRRFAWRTPRRGDGSNDSASAFRAGR